MKLYSKDAAVSMIRSMIIRGRLSHAYLISGERGVGKKTLARYMAAQILCETGTGEPCGVCKSCRMIKNDAHPDFITVSAGGKSGNYLADDLRAIISDSSVAPNEGERKIYFLPRADRSLPAAQNALLKIVEEPPPHVLFIMTAESKERILPTILSRTVNISLSESGEAECLEALADEGISEAEAREAVSVFGGNIGRCLEYIREPEAKEFVLKLKGISAALVSGDEYELLRELTSLESDRENCGYLLAEFKNVIRDAVAAKFSGKLSSPCRAEAAGLSKKFRQSSLERMYDAVCEAEDRINGNSNAVLTLSDLC